MFSYDENMLESIFCEKTESVVTMAKCRCTACNSCSCGKCYGDECISQCTGCSCSCSEGFSGIASWDSI